ncbi:MAG: hypothetical protein ACOH2F_12075 [Cellulomonas sp.]
MHALAPRRVFRALRRDWRYAAGAVGLGLLAVAVPDSASWRWACVAALVVLYPVVGSVVMSRELPADALPTVADVARATSAVVVPLPQTARGDARAELLVSRGEVLGELGAANAGRAPERPAAAVPAQRGPTTSKAAPAGAPVPSASWVPLDDAARPTLLSGWPFEPRAVESTQTGRHVVGS